MTERFYYADAYCREWTATVLRSLQREGRVGLILDRTCFYPGGGGQPPDAGWIDDQPLLEITEEDGESVHWVARQPAGSQVHCVLDWLRRFDHMQQHTGQHILSAVFETQLDAETVSFHLGEETVTIDIPLIDLSDAALQDVERGANRIVMDNVPVGIRHFEAGEPISLPLRKPPAVSGDVRIVAVEGVDYSPCGGTHVGRTGEVGPIKILRAERRGQETRIHFICGWRALRDYDRKHAIVSTLANQFTVADSDLIDSVERLADEAKRLRKEAQRAQEQLSEFEAERLLADAEQIGDVRVVHRVFDDRDGEAVKRLALRLAEQSGVVALLAARGERVQVTFARSTDVRYDMAALLREVASMFQGRGGGQPHLAQGGGTDPGGIEHALRRAADLLSER